MGVSTTSVGRLFEQPLFIGFLGLGLFWDSAGTFCVVALQILFRFPKFPVPSRIELFATEIMCEVFYLLCVILFRTPTGIKQQLLQRQLLKDRIIYYITKKVRRYLRYASLETLSLQTRKYSSA